MAGIFVECKPIDSQHPIGSAYCKEGISRFVEGNYAWAVDLAIMLAYVRNICELPDGLSYVLEKESAKTLYSLTGKLARLGETSQGDIVYCTVNQRIIRGAPAPVTLHHLWLRPDEPCETSKCRT